MAINTNVRIQLLGSDDTAVLSEAYLTLLVTDAKLFTGISDESSIPLRYYVCYLVASNWESIGAVESREGVKYRTPDAQKYLDMYNKSLVTTVDAPDDSIYAAKVSTNEGNIINEYGVVVKGDYSDQF